MKITRIKKVAVSMFAVMALAGAGAGAVSAVEPTGATPTTGIEAAETTTAEAPGTGVEIGGVAGYADTNGVDVNTQQDGNF